MNLKEKFYPETKIGGFTDIDGTIAFFNRVNSIIEKSSIVLDVGCGRGVYSEDPISYRRDLRILKGKVAKVIGIDIDKGAMHNPFIDIFFPIINDYWPINNNSVNLVLCDNVLEHIENPNIFFSEAKRVLKNGGVLCIRTPNKWNYVSIVAKIIPNKFHSKVTSVAQINRKEEDVFPTFYRCNSLNIIKKYFCKFNFLPIVYTYEAEPAYLSFSTLLYYLGILHQRFSPKFLKHTIFAFGLICKD